MLSHCGHRWPGNDAAMGGLSGQIEVGRKNTPFPPKDSVALSSARAWPHNLPTTPAGGEDGGIG
jgi:hypothetical protein